MHKVFAIARNTFREAIRNKILYSLLTFALLIILASLAFGALSIKEEARLTRDFGLGGMSLFLVIIAIFVGVNLVYKELERKTVYMLLPKPIHRYQFVLGKFLGLVLTLFVLTAIMSLVLVIVFSMQKGALTPPVARLILLIFFEVILITAIAVLFSAFSTPFLSGMFTIGIVLLGRSVAEIEAIATKLDNDIASPLLKGVAQVVPDLRFFFVTGAEVDGAHVSVNGAFISWAYVGHAAAYAGIYATLVLLFAMFLFSRRDFI